MVRASFAAWFVASFAASFAASPLLGCRFHRLPLGDAGEDERAVDAAPTIPDAAADDAGAIPIADAAPPPFCDASDPSLVACYEFELGLNPSAIDDGSSYGNDASASGVATAPGVRGLALETLPLTRVVVPDSPSLDVTGAYTIEGWVRIDAYPGNRSGVLDNNGQYGVFVLPTGALRCTTGATSSTTIPLGVWTHVACVYDGAAGTIRAYVGGVERGSGTAVSSLPTGATDGVAIASDSPCVAAPCSDLLDGGIDQLRVWNVPLSPAEIAAAARG